VPLEEARGPQPGDPPARRAPVAAYPQCVGKADKNHQKKTVSLEFKLKFLNLAGHF
jgi:hypothetical protein